MMFYKALTDAYYRCMLWQNDANFFLNDFSIINV